MVSLNFNKFPRIESHKPAGERKSSKAKRKESKLSISIEEEKSQKGEQEEDRVRSRSLEAMDNIKNQFNSFHLQPQDSFMKEPNKDLKREFINENGFIDCSFKANTAKNRCEGLLEYNLVESTSIKLDRVRLIWLHQIRSKDQHEGNVKFDGLEKERRSKGTKDTLELDTYNSEPLSKTLSTNSKVMISKENLKLLESHESENIRFRDTEEILTHHLHFVFECSSIFFGKQTWKMYQSNFDMGSMVIDPQIQSPDKSMFGSYK